MKDMVATEFEVYGSYVSVILKNAKMLNTNSLSATRKMIGSGITIVFITLSLILILSEGIGIKDSYDLMTFTLYFNPICFHSCGTSKWICAIMNANKVEKAIEQLKRCHYVGLELNQNDKDNHDYYEKMIKSKRGTSTFNTIYMGVCIVGTLKWCMSPIIIDQYNRIYSEQDIHGNFSKDLPYPGVFPWKNDNIYRYIGVYTFQTFASLGSGLGHGLYELLTITLLVHLYNQLEYLNDVLADEWDNELIFREGFSIQKFTSKIRNCVRHHREILKFHEGLVHASSVPLFIICSQSTLALCFVSLQVSTMKFYLTLESIMAVSGLFDYWLGITTQLFIYCYLATRIQDMGLRTADAIYACDWERAMNLSQYKPENPHDGNSRIMTNINQMVQISLMRAQKPIIINGGLFYVLSLETYKALSGFSFSNAIVLRQLSGDE